MVMVGQQRRLSQPLSWGRRERWAVGAVVAALATAVVTLVLINTLSGRSSSGCINASFASTTGGASVHICGTQARDLCAQTSGAAGGGNAARSVAAACRRAGYATALR